MCAQLNRGSFPRLAALFIGALSGSFLFSAAGNLCAADAGKGDWVNLSDDLKAWKEPTGKWFLAGGVGIDPSNNKRLAATPGTGLIVNGKDGRTNNLITRQEWGDVEVSLEFFIPNHSNSGVKLEGVYEIQIYDSWKVAKPTGADCGGIYPRSDSKPHYHHLDNGVPPLVNAAKKPGEWQTLDIIFHPPRFDASGKKTTNAMFEKVLLNGKLVQDHAEAATPTGAVWRDKENPTGPLLLQADHGPVAFRNVRLRPLQAK